MLEILRPTTRGLHHLEKPEKGSWVNIIRPSTEELAQLRESLDIPEEFLTTLQDMEEIPTVELHEKFIFLIIRTPHNNLKVDLEYYTVPIGVFVAKDVVVTICYHENDVVERLSGKLPRPTWRTLLAPMRLASAPHANQSRAHEPV